MAIKEHPRIAKQIGLGDHDLHPAGGIHRHRKEGKLRGVHL